VVLIELLVRALWAGVTTTRCEAQYCGVSRMDTWGTWSKVFQTAPIQPSRKYVERGSRLSINRWSENPGAGQLSWGRLLPKKQIAAAACI
jgi:hypothetical protein